MSVIPSCSYHHLPSREETAYRYDYSLCIILPHICLLFKKHCSSICMFYAVGYQGCNRVISMAWTIDKFAESIESGKWNIILFIAAASLYHRQLFFVLQFFYYSDRSSVIYGQIYGQNVCPLSVVSPYCKNACNVAGWAENSAICIFCSPRTEWSSWYIR